MRATFIYGSRGHVPEAMVLTDGTVYRLITDHVGSVRLVVNAETGEVVQRIDYDAFGRLLQDANPGFQPFGFAAQARADAKPYATGGPIGFSQARHAIWAEFPKGR